MFKQIDKYLRKRVDDVVFIELKKETQLAYEGFVFDPAVPLPILLKDFVEKVKGKEDKDIPITSILSGIVHILGIDPEFKYKEAYIQILNAIHEKPIHFILGMGFTEIQKNDFMNALISFKGALALDEENLDVLYNLGRCCEDIAQRNEGKKLEKDFMAVAFEIFEKITVVYPESHLGFYHLGFHYVNNKEYQKAEKAWVEALNLDVDENKHMEIAEKLIELRDKVVYEDGYELILSGRNQEGLEKLLSIEEKYEDWWNLLFFIGLAYRNLEQYDDALRYYRKVLVHHPKHPETYNELGLTYMMMGLINDAEESFVEGIRIKPDSNEMLCNLGLIHIEKKQFDLAEKFLTEAHKIDPEDEITENCIQYLEREKAKIEV